MNRDMDVAGIVFRKINNFLRFATLASLLAGCFQGISTKILGFCVTSLVINLVA